MRRIPLLAIIILLNACDGPQRQSLDADASLAGTWNVELTRGRLPWARTSVRGQIHLASAALPECGAEVERDGFLCRTFVKGTYSIVLDSLVRPHPHAAWTSEANAVALADGTMLLQIGGCCDRGELSGRGRVRGNRIEGRWHQQFLGDGPGGRFVLRRAGSGPAQSAAPASTEARRPPR